MHALWLLLALLPPAVNPGADRTERITPRYASAVELERMILSGEAGSLLPAGLRAWTVDTQRNTLSVAGTVTLFTAFGDASALLDPTPLRRGTITPNTTASPAALPVVIVRFLPGQSVLVLPRAGAPALLVTLQEVVSP